MGGGELERAIEARLGGLARDVIDDEPGLTRAAVLVPLLCAGDGPRLVLTRRSQRVGTHKGQVSFPGGRVDPDDRDARHTALREAHEELAIRPADVRVLGQLHDRITVTDFLVTPVVGAIDHPYPFRPEPAEIDEVYEVPLRDFLDPGVHRVERTAVHRGRPYDVHRYEVAGTVVWGATAWFIHHFLGMVQDLLGRPAAEGGATSAK